MSDWKRGDTVTLSIQVKLRGKDYSSGTKLTFLRYTWRLDKAEVKLPNGKKAIVDRNVIG